MLSTIWTIGHSSRPLDEFLALLAQQRVEVLADVRRFPGSRRQPQYAQDALAASLARKKIRYCWLPALGGRRRARADSPNGAWRNASFRGYADHMASEEFARGMDELLALAAGRRTAIMCAEAPWWRCHRALIADQLCVAGIEVVHILDRTHSVAHPMTAPARLVRGALSYAG
ncbi:MAG TPA: DUF488 domain-containing protein [Burkholderiales bacterium]